MIAFTPSASRAPQAKGCNRWHCYCTFAADCLIPTNVTGTCGLCSPPDPGPYFLTTSGFVGNNCAGCLNLNGNWVLEPDPSGTFCKWVGPWIDLETSAFVGGPCGPARARWAFISSEASIPGITWPVYLEYESGNIDQYVGNTGLTNLRDCRADDVSGNLTPFSGSGDCGGVTMPYTLKGNNATGFKWCFDAENETAAIEVGVDFMQPGDEFLLRVNADNDCAGGTVALFRDLEFEFNGTIQPYAGGTPSVIGLCLDGNGNGTAYTDNLDQILKTGLTITNNQNHVGMERTAGTTAAQLPANILRTYNPGTEFENCPTCPGHAMMQGSAGAMRKPCGPGEYRRGKPVVAKGRR